MSSSPSLWSSRRNTLIAASAAAGILVASVTTVAFAEGGDNDGQRTAPASNETLCGASFMVEEEYGDKNLQDAYERGDGYYGLETARIFYSGLPRPWPGRPDLSGMDLTVSFKAPPAEILDGDHDERLTEWFASAPTDRDIYWSYFHEPEDNVEKGQFTAAEWREAFEHVSGLANAAKNEKLFATPILMTWTAQEGSGRDWREFIPGNDVVDVLAWDGYNTVEPSPDGYMTPEKIFAETVAVNKELALPYAVAEMGSGIAKGDDGTQRAEWLGRALDYLSANKALWVQYFDVDYTSYGHADYRLRDDDPGVDVLRNFCES